jgi:hypothetical protein
MIQYSIGRNRVGENNIILFNELYKLSKETKRIYFIYHIIYHISQNKNCFTLKITFPLINDITLLFKSKNPDIFVNPLESENSDRLI